MKDILQTLFIFIVLLCLSALFSASETALTGANRIRLKTQAEGGDKKAKGALKLVESYDNTLSALLIGNNIVNTLMASIATVFCTKLFKGGSGIGIATLVVTVLIIVFGEVIPKSFANTRSEAVCKFTSFPLSIFKTIMTPVVFLLEKLKKLVIPTNKNPDPSVTEDELKVIIDEIGDEGIIEEDQTELLQSALGFADTTVDEILTPRVDIFALPTDATHEEIVNTFVEQRFSRLPVFDKTIDDIVGVVNQKDYFSKVIMGNIPSLSEVTQNCLYVPPKKKINELMGELQRKRLHLAVVTDPHGGTLGIVTLEDILEELVGEIWDEHDEIT
ncbi:MAG: hemolysin family protein, partial [Oscillospiraceae bacterium]